MGDTFAVTYPCYLPMGDGESYLTIHSEGDHCLPLLTDKPNVEDFFRHRFPNRSNIDVRTLTIPVREVLIDVLKQFEAKRQAGEHDISHIAFDPAGQPIVARTTIAEFVEYVETEGG
jgi:hypothetical protein